jgi:hypothetical protein
MKDRVSRGIRRSLLRCVLAVVSALGCVVGVVEPVAADDGAAEFVVGVSAGQRARFSRVVVRVEVLRDGVGVPAVVSVEVNGEPVGEWVTASAVKRVTLDRKWVRQKLKVRVSARPEGWTGKPVVKTVTHLPQTEYDRTLFRDVREMVMFRHGDQYAGTCAIGGDRHNALAFVGHAPEGVRKALAAVKPSAERVITGVGVSRESLAGAAGEVRAIAGPISGVTGVTYSLVSESCTPRIIVTARLTRPRNGEDPHDPGEVTLPDWAHVSMQYVWSDLEKHLAMDLGASIAWASHEAEVRTGISILITVEGWDRPVVQV